MPAIALPNIDAGAGAAVVYVNDADDAVENMVVSSPTERADPASSGDPSADDSHASVAPDEAAAAATTAERDGEPPAEPPFDQGGELPPSATQDAAAAAGLVASNNPAAGEIPPATLDEKESEAHKELVAQDPVGASAEDVNDDEHDGDGDRDEHDMAVFGAHEEPAAPVTTPGVEQDDSAITAHGNAAAAMHPPDDGIAPPPAKATLPPSDHDDLSPSRPLPGPLKPGEELDSSSSMNMLLFLVVIVLAVAALWRFKRSAHGVSWRLPRWYNSSERDRRTREAWELAEREPQREDEPVVKPRYLTD